MALLLMITVLMLALDDFKTRSVSVLELFLYGICAFLFSFVKRGGMTALYNAGANLTALGMMLLFLQIYVNTIRKQHTPILDNGIGIGDVIYLSVSSLLFTLQTYCWFIVISCLAGLLYRLLRGDKVIPFVGVSSPVLIMMLIAQWI